MNCSVDQPYRGMKVVGGRQRSVRRSLAAALEAACEQDFPYGSSSFAKYLQRREERGHNRREMQLRYGHLASICSPLLHDLRASDHAVTAADPDTYMASTAMTALHLSKCLNDLNACIVKLKSC